MSSNPQADPDRTANSDPQAGGNAAPGEGGQQQFTPEELRKAARAQRILYIVMVIFILLPFLVLWLRKSWQEPVDAGAPATGGEQIRVEEAVVEQAGAGQSTLEVSGAEQIVVEQAGAGAADAQ